MSTPAVTAVTPVRPGLRALPDTSFARTEVVTPAMCGHNSLFAGRVGDWTWDAVSAACDVDAYRAHDETGVPTYLSFHYFRIRGGSALHPLLLTFGDRLDVVSQVFGLGSESLLTVHRVARDGEALHVENVNRWISRSRPDTNRDLVRAAPAGFDHHRLPAVPPDLDPRRAYTGARRDLTFRPWAAGGPTLALEYPVEASRDLNGVGLLYFASYFSVVDWAVLGACGGTSAAARPTSSAAPSSTTSSSTSATPTPTACWRSRWARAVLEEAEVGRHRDPRPGHRRGAGGQTPSCVTRHRQEVSAP